jgi:PAS domain S-box-containing protein
MQRSEVSGAPSGGRFDLAFDKSPLGMAIVDLDLKVRRVNQALCRALGYTEAEIKAQSFIAFTHPDDRGKDRDLVEQLFAEKIPSYRVEKRFITRDGSLAWLDVTALLIRGDQNQVLYGLAMVENITERKRAYEALRTSDERYRSFVVNSSEGIWRFEVEQPIDITLPAEEQIALFYKHAYLAECNDAMARMYGHKRADDIVGSRFGQFAMASNPANIPALKRFVKHGYRLHELETSDLDADGSQKFFSNNVIGIVINGMLLRIWGTQRDETQRKRSEDELRRSHSQLRLLAGKLQTAREQERTDIAREMHDVLGQSLTSLKIDLSWLKKTAQKSSDPAVGTLLDERINGALRQLDETIKYVKILSTELRPGVLDKFGLGAAIEWQCQEFEQRTGIQCSVKVPQKEFSLSNERSTALFRIMQEAFVNVVRHSQATTVSIELRVGKSEAMLRAHDNGRGITLAEIVDPSSLGLLGMRERAELLGGHFNIEGGSGTTVTVQMPLTGAETGPAETSDDQGAHSRRSSSCP